MYDSVALFAAGLQSLDRSHKLKPVNLSCEQETPWEDGTSLYNYLNSVSEFFCVTFCLSLLPLKRLKLNTMNH